MSYYDNGQPKDLITYKVIEKKSEVEYGYMKNHKVKESVMDGHSQSYSNKDYKLTEEGNYKNGKKEGVWKDYFPGGKMSAVVTNYKNGELDGVMQEFDRSGKIISETNYSKGLKNGKFTVYNSDGKPVVQKVFSNGTEVRQSRF
jgi:antitoxin component YwqK of YwqJK toxin-antitoxin module